MKDRQSLAIIAGVLGMYLLVHAALAGYGLYWANEALRPPVLIDGPYLPELREGYATLAVLFFVLATLSALSMTACVGFLRNYNWAGRLWLMTSVVAVVCIALAVVSLGVAWTHYLFELGAIGVSWYALRLRTGHREG